MKEGMHAQGATSARWAHVVSTAASIETRVERALPREALNRVPNTPVQTDVVVVIPAYNEERFIGSVVITARQYAEKVIVVDDGSTDRTAQVAEMAGAEVIRLAENVGKGGALNEGFRRACKLRPRAVVMLDGDAQHDPAEIAQLVQPITRGEADLVIGSRFLDKKSIIPRWRQAGQHALTALTNAASGTTSTDSQSGYRAFSLSALDKLWFRSKGLAMESEMQFLAQRAGLRVVEVPICVQYLDGNKRNPVAHGLQVIDSILGLVARRHPLMFMGVPAVVLLIAGLVLGVSVIETINLRHAVPLGTATLSTLLLIVGLVLGVAGVILNTLEHFMGHLWEELHTTLRRGSDSDSQAHAGVGTDTPALLTLYDNPRSLPTTLREDTCS